MNPALRARLGEVLGRIETVRALLGRDINDAYAVEAGGETLFVKTRADAPSDMYEVEARGLRFLEAGALRVPRVVAVDPAFLVLEYLPPTSSSADFDEVLGRGLAALHQASPAGFGLDHDNYVGSLPQRNTPCATWAEFYWERRLRPLSRELPSALRHRFDSLAEILPECVGPAEPPARLHGDLWGGNVHRAGEPVLIDPAVYGGHREIDLAMMRLFGGFSARVFAAYDEAHPLAHEHERRVPLYQLYPLLVHVGIFGASYLPAVSRALDELGV